MNRHRVTFYPSGRGKARCAPDPDYPEGKPLDVSAGRLFVCRLTLPYPAPECGHFQVDCRVCSISIAVTAAGRPDDPRELTVPCKFPEFELAYLQSVRRLIGIRQLMTRLRMLLVDAIYVTGQVTLLVAPPGEELDSAIDKVNEISGIPRAEG